MELTALLEAIHGNVVVTSSRVVHKTIPNAASETVDGWSLIDAGRSAMPFLNGALPLPSHKSLDIGVAEDWFESRGSQPLFRMQVGVHDELIEQLMASGYVVRREEPILCAQAPEIPTYEGVLEIVPVRNDDELSAMFKRVGISPEADDFSAQMSRVTAVMPNAAEQWGLIDDELVAGSIVVTSPPVAGIYAVSCEPNFRRRGFGTAITWAAVKEGLAIGAEYVFMGSTPMALPIYRKMGFEPVCTYRMLVRPEPSE